MVECDPCCAREPSERCAPTQATAPCAPRPTPRPHAASRVLPQAAPHTAISGLPLTARAWFRQVQQPGCAHFQLYPQPPVPSPTAQPQLQPPHHSPSPDPACHDTPRPLTRPTPHLTPPRCSGWAASCPQPSRSAQGAGRGARGPRAEPRAAARGGAASQAAHRAAAPPAGRQLRGRAT